MNAPHDALENGGVERTRQCAHIATVDATISSSVNSLLGAPAFLTYSCKYFDQVFQDKLQTWMASKAISFEERNYDLSNDLVRG